MKRIFRRIFQEVAFILTAVLIFGLLYIALSFLIDGKVSIW